MPEGLVRRWAAAAMLTAVVWGAAAQAETLTASSPELLRDVLRGFGSAELERDDSGDPRVTGRIEGVRYTLWFYGCVDGADCKQVVFSSGFAGAHLSAERVNEWNRGMKFGRAFVDEAGDPWIEMSVNLFGGVTRENFDDTVDWWRVAAKQFRDLVYSEDTARSEQ